MAGTFHAMSMATHMLVCEASHRIIPGEEERLRALQYVCLALPRTAQALHEQVRQLSCARLTGVLPSSDGEGPCAGMA